MKKADMIAFGNKKQYDRASWITAVGGVIMAIGTLGILGSHTWYKGADANTDEVICKVHTQVKESATKKK